MGVCVSHSFQTNLLVFSLLSPGFWPGLGILMFWALGFHISSPVLEGVFTIIQHHQPPIRSIPLHPATISHNYIPRKSWKKHKNPWKSCDQLDKSMKMPSIGCLKFPSSSWCFFCWHIHRWPRPRSPSQRGDFIPYRRLDDKMPWNMDFTCDFTTKWCPIVI